jgi:outer membrane protein TolC
MSIRKYVLVLLSALVLVGCKVGPNYRPPETPVPDAYLEADEGSTEPVDDSELVHWWMAFDDPLLDALLERALEGNFDFHIALHKIVAARANYWSQFTQLLPEFVMGAQASRSKASESFASAQNLRTIPTAGGMITTERLSP